MKRKFTPITRFLAALALLELALLCMVGTLQVENVFPAVVLLFVSGMGLGLRYFVPPLFRLMLKPLQRVYSAEDKFKTAYLMRALPILGLLFLAHTLQAQVSGFVFRDFNGNGIQGTLAPNLEPGVSGVIINAYDASNTIIASFTSGATGTYSIPASGAAYSGTPGSNTGFVAAAAAVRLEFVIPDAVADVCGLSSSIDYTSNAGSAYGSSVQFVSGGATNVNFAINNPSDWTSTTNPQIITSCYSMGPIGGTGRVQAADASVIRINENDKVVLPAGIPGSAPNGDPTIIANFGQVGTVYGMAYQKQSNRMFMSSIVRRHMPFIENVSGSPANGSTGRIFTTDLGMALPNGITFIDVNTIGINTGSIVRSDMTSNFDWFCDADAGLKAGKVGIGDIDLSDDGTKLFLVNLADRTVYGIDITTPLTTPTSGSVTSYAANAPWLTNPTYQCNNGVARPFALKYYRNKLYVGVICTAENGGTRDDLYARVFELDPATNTWTATPIVEIQLNYTKDGASGNTNTNPPFSTDVENRQWNPWPSFTSDTNNPEIAGVYPHPLFTDIEFDVDGSIIIGLGDRNGYASGAGVLNVSNASPAGGRAVAANCLGGSDQGFTGPYVAGVSGGDLIRAGRTPSGTCTYQVESNGAAYVNGTLVTSSPGTNHQGIGGGEFYNDGLADNSNHAETFVGGLGIYPGTNQLLGAVYNPIRTVSGGLMWWDNTTGNKTHGFELYEGFAIPSPSKGAGIGDVEFISSALNMLEIGNRVWMDTDNDGIQDADEMGIGSVPVKLYLGTTQVGATNTAPDGTFYFNNANVNLNSATGILPNTAYTIRVNAADFPTGKLLSTLQNVGGAGQPDVRDNDAALNAGNAEIAVTTGKYGENNHTLDMGFADAASCVNPTGITFTQTPATCTSANAPQNDGSITLVSANNGTHYGISTLGAATYDGPTTIAGASAISLPQVVKSSIPNTGGTYIVRIFNGADDCYTDQAVAAPNISCTCPVLPCAGTTVTKN